MPTVRAVALVVLVASSAAVPLASGGTQRSHDELAPPRIVVTRSQKGLPRGCTPSEAARLLHQAFTAFNERRYRAFVRFFVNPGKPESERFRWFSMSDGFADVLALDAPHLLRYARERAPAHDRIFLRLIDIGADRVLRTAAFAFVAQRGADDRPDDAGGSAGIVEGKGEYDCDAQTIHVFSASMEPAPGRYPHPFTGGGPCPVPRGWTPERRYVVACVRPRA